MPGLLAVLLPVAGRLQEREQLAAGIMTAENKHQWQNADPVQQPTAVPDKTSPEQPVMPVLQSPTSKEAWGLPAASSRVLRTSADTCSEAVLVVQMS